MSSIDQGKERMMAAELKSILHGINSVAELKLSAETQPLLQEFVRKNDAAALHRSWAAVNTEAQPPPPPPPPAPEPKGEPVPIAGGVGDGVSLATLPGKVWCEVQDWSVHARERQPELVLRPWGGADALRRGAWVEGRINVTRGATGGVAVLGHGVMEGGRRFTYHGGRRERPQLI